MKKVLIIKSHPSSKGFTQNICETYKTESSKENEVKIIDLYSKKYFLNFLNFEDKFELKSLDNSEISNIKNKISWADELVFIFPIWWGDCPAIMKNFFDVIIQSGFAFKYENGKQIKLLKGKTAKVFATCDGPSIMYKLFLRPMWKFGRLNFCGIKLKSFVVFDRMFRRGDSERKYFLNRVKVITKL